MFCYSYFELRHILKFIFQKLAKFKLLRKSTTVMWILMQASLQDKVRSHMHNIAHAFSRTNLIHLCSLDLIEKVNS